MTKKPQPKAPGQGRGETIASIHKTNIIRHDGLCHSLAKNDITEVVGILFDSH